MKPDELKAAMRHAKRERRLGEGATCILCGLEDMAALLKVPRGLLAGHHVVGHSNDAELVVLLCRNCHAQVTEKLRDGGVSMGPPPTILDRIINILHALAVFFEDLAARFRVWLEEVLKLRNWLDREHPDWRTPQKSD